jgi:hypothetical protein
MLVIAVVSLVCGVSAHMRFEHPKPREYETGIKNGPCGSTTFWSDDQEVTDLAPGPQVLLFYEDVFHRGAPMRIAISQGSDNDFEDHVIAAHLPHNDAATGDAYYFSIVVDVPDVKCDKCVMQVLSVMTDKIGPGKCCSYPTESAYKCFSVYHSCANVRINGTAATLPPGLPNKAFTQVFTKNEGTTTAYSLNATTKQWALTGSYPLFEPKSCVCDKARCDFISSQKGTGTVTPGDRSNLTTPTAAASGVGLAVVASVIAALAHA